mmetsp:Transcript_392/g.388  ORF Transcript_392/g.388 Transcript_392/m.388 type:complete len:204 (+) Transcript_392:35-646(+)
MNSILIKHTEKEKEIREFHLGRPFEYQIALLENFHNLLLEFLDFGWFVLVHILVLLIIFAFIILVFAIFICIHLLLFVFNFLQSLKALLFSTFLPRAFGLLYCFGDFVVNLHHSGEVSFDLFFFGLLFGSVCVADTLQDLEVLEEHPHDSPLSENRSECFVLSHEADPQQAVPFHEVYLGRRVLRLDSHHGRLDFWRRLEAVP